MNSKEETLVKWVQTFYKENPEYLEFVRSVACGRSNTISLRILDWLVTSYAKRHSVVIFHNGQAVHLHSNYKNFLASHSKRLFDAFRRRQRVSVDETGAITTVLIDDETEPYFVTTIAQLVFFQWAHSIGVIAYAEEHVRHIEDDLRSYRVSSSDLHSRSPRSASKAPSEPHSVWPDSKAAVGATVMVRGDVSISFV